MTIQGLPSLDAMGVRAGRMHAGDAHAFYVYVPHGKDRPGGKLSLVSADAGGLLDLASLDLRDADGVEAAASEALVDGQFSYPSCAENRTNLLAHFGIIPCGVRKSGSDVAVEIGCLAVTLVPALADVVRAEIVDQIDAALDRSGRSAIIDMIGRGRIELYLSIRKAYERADGIASIQSSSDSVIHFLFRLPFDRVDTTLRASKAYPSLRLAIARMGGTTALEKEAGLAALDHIGFPGRSPRGLLRRLVGVDVMPLGKDFLKLVARIPIDWVPSRDETFEWRCFRFLGPLLNSAEERWRVPLDRLLEGSGGRWSELLGRLLGAPEGMEGILAVEKTLDSFDAFSLYLGEASELMAAVRDVTDVVKDFATTVTRPCIAHCGGDPSASDEAIAAASRFLLSDRTFASVLSMSRLWHERGVRIEGRRVGEWEWEPLLPRWRDPSTGIEFLPLSDRRSLEDEGAKGPDRNGIDGLAHCVATYTASSWKGRCAIVSLRTESKGGSSRRSTAEIRLRESFVVAQHRGSGNGDPPSDARAALEAYVTGLNDGSIPADLGTWKAARDRRMLTLEEECGYDWRDPEAIERAYAAWAPFLPSPKRSLDLGELAGRFGATSPSRMPGP